LHGRGRRIARKLKAQEPYNCSRALFKTFAIFKIEASPTFSASLNLALAIFKGQLDRYLSLLS